MHDERGDVILQGLTKLLVALALVALLVHEGGAVGVNVLQLDEAGQSAALAGATVRADSGRSREVEAAIRRRVGREQRAELVDWRVQGDEVIVTLRRDAQTLLLHRIGPLAGWARASVTKSSRGAQALGR